MGIVKLATMLLCLVNEVSQHRTIDPLEDMRKSNKSQSRTGLDNRLVQWLQEFFFLNKFIYFWLCWVFVSMQGLSLVAASGGHSSSRCVGLSLSRPLLLQSTGSRCAGSVVVAHGPSCSTACGISPDQGSNPCPLHWQADSQPLRHQGSPGILKFDGLSGFFFLKSQYQFLPK